MGLVVNPRYLMNMPSYVSILTGLNLLSILAYFGGYYYGESSVMIVTKCIPLMLIAFQAHIISERSLLVYKRSLAKIYFKAFTAAAIGDACMIWFEDEINPAFVAGLSWFAVSILYIITALYYKLPPYYYPNENVWWKFLITIPCSFIYFGYMGNFNLLATNLSGTAGIIIRIILAGYAYLLTWMMWRSVYRYVFYSSNLELTNAHILNIIGCILFASSDSVLAWSALVSPVPYSPIILLVLYWGGMWCLGMSVVYL